MAGGVSARATVSGSSAASSPAIRSARIDWRQSAKSGRRCPDGWFIRETEWEAAQTVCLWRDASASMRWRSRWRAVEKRERADLLLLALASLLLRGGERVTMIAAGRPPGRRPRRPGPAGGGAGRRRTTMPALPPARAAAAPRTRGAVRRFPVAAGRRSRQRSAASPRFRSLATCCRSSIPAEADLPYQRPHPLPRPGARGRHADPARRRRSRCLRAAAEGAAGRAWRRSAPPPASASRIHRTDHPPEAALLGLYTALTAR